MTPLFPWNPDHPCFVDFSESTLEHDMRIVDEGQGDGIYYQACWAAVCRNCNFEDDADNWCGDEY